MMKSVGLLLLTPVLAAFVPAVAHAQGAAPLEDVAFVNVSLGVQAQTHQISATSGFPLYDETARIATSQRVGRGLVVDVSGGYRLWHRLFGALGVSTSHGSGDGTVTASIPDPLFFNRPATTTTPATGLGQTTVAINLQGVWLMPLTDKIDVAIGLGPSIVHVKQELPTVTVAPGTQTATATTTSESKWTGKAGTVSLDLSYKLTDERRAGLFVRYAGGAVNLPSAPNMKFGGLQVGVGLRLRF